MVFAERIESRNESHPRRLANPARLFGVDKTREAFQTGVTGRYDCAERSPPVPKSGVVLVPSGLF
jgi:hypothetical protein